MTEDAPFVVFDHKTLELSEWVEAGDEIKCPNCNLQHQLECATENGKPIQRLLFYKCGESCYLGAIANRLISKS